MHGNDKQMRGELEQEIRHAALRTKGMDGCRTAGEYAEWLQVQVPSPYYSEPFLHIFFLLQLFVDGECAKEKRDGRFHAYRSSARSQEKKRGAISKQGRV